MSFRDRFKNKKGSLGKQHVTQNNNKDSRNRIPSIILKDKLPAGVEVWACKEGDHLFDIIPWPAGPDMPLGEDGAPIIQEGDLSYVLDLKVHQNVGSMKVPYVCPYENFGKPCPICEFIKDNDLNTDDWKALAPKRRVVYLIWLHDSRDTEKKGIQIWEVSHYSMEEKLNAIAALPKGGGAINFSDFDEGMTVAFQRKGSGAKNTQYLGHRFVPRESNIPDKLLDRTFSVDQVIKMHSSYAEIEEAFKGQKSKYSSNEDIDNAGSGYDGYSTGDDVPDFMEEYDEKAKPNGDKSEKKEKSSTGKKKLVFKRKK